MPVGPPVEPPRPPPPPEVILEGIAVAKPEVVPERPVERRFTVEVKKPTAWFDEFLDVQKGEAPRRGFTVGKVELADDVASDLRTSVKIFGAEKDTSVSFEIRSDLYYSSARLEKDGGFNPTGQVVKVAKNLRERRIKVKFVTSHAAAEMMLLERDGVHCLVDLGWSSPVEKPDIKGYSSLFRGWGDVTATMRKGEEPPPPPMEGVKQNEPIRFVLDDGKGESQVIHAKNQIELGRQLTGYAGMLGDFVDSYYQVRQAQPANNTLSLNIPDWETYIGDDPSLALMTAPSGEGKNFFDNIFGRKEQDEVGVFLTPEERASMPSLADIGGQPEAVEEARKLAMAIKFADVFTKRGVDRPRGILLQGPPGTGKTMLAKAIAREVGAEFMSLSVTDLVSKWYGEAEKHVQEFFDRAKAVANEGRDVIAFIDEIDSVVPTREGAHEATQRMVAVFLQNMDGLKNNPRLTILAATNQPERIDSAFLRPGRLDKKIEVGLPDAEGRAQILDIHLQKHAERIGDASELIAPDLDTRKVAEALGNISGADIAGIVNLALEEKATAEIRNLNGEKGGKPWTPLTAEDLLTTKEKYMKAPREKRTMGFVPPRT